MTNVQNPNPNQSSNPNDQTLGLGHWDLIGIWDLAPMTTLIKSGRIITATDDYIADIFIDGETVKTIGSKLAVSADKTIDAAGKLVIPGAIDPHVHMELPFGGTV